MKNKGNKVLVILITIFTFAIILFAGTYAYFNSVGSLGNVVVSANVAENNSIFTSSGSDIHLEIETIDMQQNEDYLGLVAEDSGYLNVTYLSGTTEPISCEYNVYYKWISGEYTITDPEQLEFTYEVGDGGKGLLAEETNFVPSWYTEPVKISSEKVKITNGSLTTPTVNSHDITARFYNLDKDQTANADKRLKIRFYVDDIVCGVEDKVSVLYFYDNAKAPDMDEVTRGGSITLPLPVKGDDIFNGWYTYGPAGTFVGNAGDSFTPTKDTTMLYAHWTETLRSKILSSNDIIEEAPTLTNSANNTDDESGLYKVQVTNGFGGQSATGDTYIFRGEVDNNYVSFAGKTWRIVRINENGTIRLVLDQVVTNSTTYFNSTTSNYTNMYYTNSDIIKDAANNWYTNNITINSNYSSKVASGYYFCEQSKVAGSTSHTTPNTTTPFASQYTANLSCTNDGPGKGLVNSTIGLLTYDEVVYAGMYYLKTYQTNYLYSSNSFWLMSPAGFYTSVGTKSASVWQLTSSMGLLQNSVDRYSDLRPVINLNANVIATGSGTVGDKYIVQ